MKMKGLVFLFPGQGSQYVGMGKALCEDFVIARDTFAEANDVLGFDLQKLCFEGELDELTKTANAQPAILTASVAAYRVFMQEVGVTPEFVAGHSLGEYSALVATGALNFADAVKLVNLRGMFMQEAVPVGVGAMAAVVKVKRSVVEDVCAEVSTSDEMVVAANMNSPEQTVISGHKSAVEKAQIKLEELGGDVRMLNVSAPFHSPLMKPAAVKMHEQLEKIVFGEMTCPVIANVTALPYKTTNNLIQNLTDQIVMPVRWEESMNYLANVRVLQAIEMGPKNVLKTIMKYCRPEIKVFNFEKQDDLEKVREVIPAEDLTKVIAKCLAIAICVKNRNWNNDEYQKGVVEPYRNIQQLQATIEQEGRTATLEEAKASLEMLKSVFTTKQVPFGEQIDRFEEILDLTGTRQHFAGFVPQVA